MILDTTKYVNSLEKCDYIFFKDNGVDIEKTITELSIATSIPIVAVVCYAIKLLGPSEKLLDMKAKLVAFYEYSEVII
jgi:hypothetical protein